MPGPTAALLPQAVPTITGIVTNNAERVCRCSVTSSDNCRCVADASILPGGTGATIMPGVSPRPNGWRGAGGRVYLLRYTANATATGLGCEGFAQVCVIRQRRNLRGAPPPACQPFTSSVTVRDATRCGNVTTSLASGVDTGAEVFRLLGL
jgi:hypothetical protein